MKKVNISIDDVSPHPLSSTKVLNRCYELIREFPEIKISLFIPIAYWRTIRAEVATKEPLPISLFPDFIRDIKSLPKKNFEICYHGLYHGIPGKTDNDEFEKLSYQEALQKFDVMKKIVDDADLSKEFKPIFRPPAWRMSGESIKAAKDIGIEILALSPEGYAKKTYDKEDEKFKNVVYYNCSPPWKNLSLFDKTEIVYHACEWDKNYLDEAKTKELSEFIRENKDDIEFCFMGEMNK